MRAGTSHEALSGCGAAGYTLLRLLASGGMGSVSLVVRREGSFERVYALKRLHPHLVEDEQLRAMFLDEARFAGLIRHANVVSVLDVGEDQRGPYLVMDYVDGLPLSSLMQQVVGAGQAFPFQVCLSIAAQIADGLQAAHEVCSPTGELLNLVHRDVSPQNVLVGFDGVVRVVDFGIAKSLDQSSRTATGALKGKLGYMAPEQLRFEEPSQQSDLFALGVLLYELVAGRRLYANLSGLDGARRALTEPAPDVSDDRPDAPPGLVALLFELLAKEPSSRPASAREASRRLRSIRMELAAAEGPIELEDYCEELLGERRAAAARELSELLRSTPAGADAAPLDAEQGLEGVEGSAVQRSPTVAAAREPSQPSAPTTPPAPQGRRVRAMLLTAGLSGAALSALAVASWGWPQRGAPGPTQPERAQVRLEVDSSPPGARVSLAGEPFGVTPLSINVEKSAGARLISIEKNGFRTETKYVPGDADQRISLALSALGSRDALPAGAKPSASAGPPPASGAPEMVAGGEAGRAPKPGETNRTPPPKNPITGGAKPAKPGTAQKDFERFD